MSRWETDAGRASRAMVVGGFVGAATTSLAALLLMGLGDAALGFWPLAFVTALFAFAVGLGCAAPLWTLLHRWGLRSWPWAVTLGVAMGMGVVGFVGVVEGGSLYDWFEPALLVGGSCGLIGLLIWRLAYRRVR